MNNSPFILSGHLGWLAVVNNAAMTLGLQVYLHDPAFRCFAYVPSGAIAGSDDDSVLNV